jgi:ribose transport system substrate-binding protein
MTTDNGYQCAQLDAAQAAATRLGVEVEILDADNDAVTQTQQILTAVQRKNDRPEAIICIAVGSGMPQVAQAAAAAGIGWAIVNREVDYLEELRRKHGVIAFSVRSDDQAIGRIMGQQAAALLPQGGSVLYLTGPSSSDVSQLRLTGFQSTRPENIKVRTISGQWTRESGRHAITSLLQLSTSAMTNIDLVICQNDDMAEGARQAFLDAGQHWNHLRFTGVDGLPEGGQILVQQLKLSATVVVPTTADVALEAFVAAKKGMAPPLHISVEPSSFPAVERIEPIFHAV